MQASTSRLDESHGELTLDGLSTSEAHELVAEAPGFKPKRLTFSGAAFETKDVSLDLEPEPVTVAAHDHDARLGKAPATDHVAAAAAAPKGIGKLNVGAAGGWCNVSVDGQARGATPLAGLELAAGSHSVTCVSPDGKTQTSQATVEPDAVARVKFSL